MHVCFRIAITAGGGQRGVIEGVVPEIDEGCVAIKRSREGALFDMV
jgi:hypothetical protein